MSDDPGLARVDTVDEPPRIAKLARNHAGYRVPWFVAIIDGEPDFRIVEMGRLERAIREQRCWICGGLLFGAATFAIGPMCAVNRVSSEPPSHYACAEYAARVCPFLTNPKKRRREGHIPDDAEPPAGIMIARNPGVTLLWTSATWHVQVVEAHDGIRAGLLFDIGEPMRVAWFAHGRTATRAEVANAFTAGCPALRAMAEAEGPEAVAHYERRLATALQLVPSA